MQDSRFVHDLCITLPGAGVSQPFGPDHDVWKVGSKIFAIIGRNGDAVSVKTNHVETAALLIEAGVATRAPYLHASWVRFCFGRIEDAELTARLHASYGLIRGALPKKLQAALGGRWGPE